MRVVYKSTTPAPDTSLRYYTCDNCGKEFRYNPETCANKLNLPSWEELKRGNIHELGDDYKYWCGPCVIALNLNPE